MKNNILYFAVFSFVVCLGSCSGCHFSKGFKDDLSTHLSMKYNGLSVSDVYLADDSGRRLTDNHVSYGHHYNIVATSVDGFALMDGKAYPGVELTIKDSQGNILLHAPDLIADQTKDGLTGSINQLYGSFTVGDPMKIGQHYKILVHFFDKKNPDNVIDVNEEIEVVQ